MPVRYGVRGQSMCVGAKWQGRAEDQTHSTVAYSAVKTTLTPHAGVFVLGLYAQRGGSAIATHFL